MDAKKTIDELLADADTPEGRARVLAAIWKNGGPVYGSDPAFPGMIIEAHADGTKRIGKFVNRQFVPLDESPQG